MYMYRGRRAAAAAEGGGGRWRRRRRRAAAEAAEEEETSLGVIMTHRNQVSYFIVQVLFLSLFHLIFSSRFIVHCPQFWLSVFK